jgi:hypothetical protein
MGPSEPSGSSGSTTRTWVLRGRRALRAATLSLSSRTEKREPRHRRHARRVRSGYGGVNRTGSGRTPRGRSADQVPTNLRAIAVGRRSPAPTRRSCQRLRLEWLQVQPHCGRHGLAAASRCRTPDPACEPADYPHANSTIETNLARSHLPSTTAHITRRAEAIGIRNLRAANPGSLRECVLQPVARRQTRRCHGV